MTQARATVIQFSRKGLVIWIGLVVFVAFWMFVLGIMVGRGMAPVNLETGKLEKELADLKAKMLRQEQEKVDAQAAGKAGEKPELEFYEALKNPGKATPFKPVKPLVPAPAPKPPDDPKPVPEAKPVEPPAAAKPSPKTTAPVAVPKPALASTPKMAAATERGHFSVQVASVQESRGAEQLVEQLRKKGYQAYQIRSEVAGKGVWYRIRVGAFGDRGAAEKMLARLKGDKYGGMVVSTK